MVDEAHKRIVPAKPPKGFKSFTDWLRDAAPTIRRGLQAELARYCGVEPQHVSGWLRRGSIPERPTMPRIAEWAQVDPGALQALADEQLHQRQLDKAERRQTPRPPKAQRGTKRATR